MTFTVAVAPLANVPRLQLAPLQTPCDDDDDTKDRFAARVLVSVTVFASAGPLFFTVIV